MTKQYRQLQVKHADTEHLDKTKTYSLFCLEIVFLLFAHDAVYLATVQPVCIYIL